MKPFSVNIVEFTVQQCFYCDVGVVYCSNSSYCVKYLFDFGLLVLFVGELDVGWGQGIYSFLHCRHDPALWWLWNAAYVSNLTLECPSGQESQDWQDLDVNRDVFCPCCLPLYPTSSTTSRTINRATDGEFCATIPAGPDFDTMISIIPFSREQLTSTQGDDNSLQGLSISPFTPPTNRIEVREHQGLLYRQIQKGDNYGKIHRP